jgi:hypothetical protein
MQKGKKMSSNNPSRQRLRVKAIPKRLEITDDEGWTHVTKSNGPVSRKLKSKPSTTQSNNTETSIGLLLSPAEAPPRTTIVQLRKQYATHLQRWESSSAWESSRHLLQGHAQSSVTSLKNIVCIGLGSPSGLVRGGWVDRRSVALDQLGALHSILNLLKTTGLS